MIYVYLISTAVVMIGIFLILKNFVNQNKIENQIQSLVKNKNYEHAADLRLQQGFPEEAYFILNLGNCHEKAFYLSLSLNMLDKAAFHAENCNKIKESAHLYQKIQDFENAYRLYKNLNQYKEAAECLEQTSSHDPQQMALCWDMACKTLIESFHQKEDDKILENILYVSQKACQSYKNCDNEFKYKYFLNLNQKYYHLSNKKSCSSNPLNENILNTNTNEIPTTFQKKISKNYFNLNPNSLLINQNKLQNKDNNNFEPIFETTQKTNFKKVDFYYKFFLREMIAQNNISVSYQAVDLIREQEIILKIFKNINIDKNFIISEYFKKIEIFLSINHPNFMKSYEFGFIKNQPYISLELITGQDYFSILKNYPQGIPVQDLLFIMDQLLSAFDYLDQKKLYYYKISPFNLIKTQAGIKLIDFQILESLLIFPRTLITKNKENPYRSPEEREKNIVDIKSNIFSLGILFYELATGTLPLKNKKNIIIKPHLLRQDLPSQISEIIFQCLHDNPIDRPSSPFIIKNALNFYHNNLEKSKKINFTKNQEDDFKNEFDLNHSFDELSDEPIEPNGDLKKNFKDFDFNLNWNEIESLMEDYTVNPDSSSKN
jgi:hypothetical protein